MLRIGCNCSLLCLGKGRSLCRLSSKLLSSLSSRGGNQTKAVFAETTGSIIFPPLLWKVCSALGHISISGQKNPTSNLYPKIKYIPWPSDQPGAWERAAMLVEMVLLSFYQLRRVLGLIASFFCNSGLPSHLSKDIQAFARINQPIWTPALPGS